MFLSFKVWNKFMMEKSASLHFIYSTLKAVFFIIMVCVLVGCITTDSRISVSQYPTITTSTECSNRFIEHELPHITTTRSTPPEFFDSNGAGVALADLDNNGLIDIVLAGLSTPVTILWNQGKMQFIKSSLSIERTRSVNIVDIDSDGRLDLVFTHVNGLPQYGRELLILGHLPGLETQIQDYGFRFILWHGAI